MKLPVDIPDLMRSRTKVTEEREQPLRIGVFVDVEAPDALVAAVREALRPQTGGARLHVEACAPGETLLVDSTADAVIALAGPGVTLARSLGASRDLFVPSVVLAMGERADTMSRRLSHPILDTVAAETPEEVVHHLGQWMVDRLNGKRLALATNFAFMRRVVAEESVKATAFQNGVIGLVAIIPGADMPIMTANQAKMVMQIAGAYGEPLGVERLKELAAVVGSGFALRTIAREVLGVVPGFGWAVKASIAYTGTVAMGYAAIEYFEEGGDVHGLVDRVKSARDKAVGAARSRMARGEEADGPLPARAYVVAGALEGPPAIADSGPVLPATDVLAEQVVLGAGDP